MCRPDHAAGMKDLFPQLLQVAESSPLFILFRDSPSWREPPCSRSCPLPGVAYIQWPVEASPYPNSGNSEGLPQLQSSHGVSWGICWGCIPAPFLLPHLASFTSFLGDENTLLHPNLHGRVSVQGTNISLWFTCYLHLRFHLFVGKTGILLVSTTWNWDMY